MESEVGADEDQAGPLDRFGELGPLGQEAVARMDGLGAGLEGGRDDRVDPQVALGGGPARVRTATSAARTWPPPASASL